MHERPVVHVRVEVHDVEPVLEGAHHWVRDRVVAADHYRQGAGGEDPGHVARDVVERLRHVRVHDVGVAAVDEATVDSLVVEVPAILGDVVIPALTVHGATAGELDRELADLAGANRAPGFQGEPSSLGAPRTAMSASSLPRSVQVGLRRNETKPVYGRSQRGSRVA